MACLESGNYIQIRNALIVLTKVRGDESSGVIERINTVRNMFAFENVLSDH